MKEILSVFGLFIISLLLNAIVTKYSAKKVLGIELSFLKSNLVVLGKSLAMLLAGFCVGYGIKIGFNGATELKSAKLIALSSVTLLSFFVYWYLLGRISATRITLWGMTKTVITETGIMIGSIVGIALILAIFITAFGLK